MFTEPTTFILGAGASWHYGYPTGADLIDQVLERAMDSGFFQRSISNDRNNLTKPLSQKIIQLADFDSPLFVNYDFYDTATANQMLEGIYGHLNDKNNNLRFKLATINPLVIDSFLSENSSISDIGRFNIARAILECDAREYRLQYNINRDQKPDHEINPPDIKKKIFRKTDDWYRFLIYKIVKGCETIDDLLGQAEYLKIITFNYDISLEKRLYSALMKIDIFDKKKDVSEAIELQEKQRKIKQFISDIVIHVYGSISDEYDQRSYGVEIHNPENAAFDCENLDFLLDSYKGLELISPKDNSQNVIDRGEVCSDWLGKSNYIYILGFGFDEQNSKIIGLGDVFQKNGKTVYFTNFGNSDVVNKRFEKLIFGTNHSGCHQLFLNNGVAFRPDNLSRVLYIEKSINNVYDALDKDFDL